MDFALKRTAAAAAVIATLLVFGTQAGRGQESYAPGVKTTSEAFAESLVARSMDDSDLLLTTRAMESSSTGDVTSWRNSNTGNSYSVTATRSYRAAIGPCRDFDAVGEIQGHKEVARGTACRRGDGSWNLQVKSIQ